MKTVINRMIFREGKHLWVKVKFENTFYLINIFKTKIVFKYNTNIESKV